MMFFGKDPRILAMRKTNRRLMGATAACVTLAMSSASYAFGPISPVVNSSGEKAEPTISKVEQILTVAVLILEFATHSVSNDQTPEQDSSQSDAAIKEVECLEAECLEAERLSQTEMVSGLSKKRRTEKRNRAIIPVPLFF